MKNLYLHIGLSKTGTSALQVVFAQNKETLKKHGIHYPAWGIEDGLKGCISSGNGLKIAKFLNESLAFKFPMENIKEEIEHELSFNFPVVLFSSEFLYDFDLQKMTFLKEIAKGKGYQIKIICYVRDFVPMYESLYGQEVKRGLCTKNYKEYIASVTVPQYSIINRFLDFFDKDNIVVKKYAEKFNTAELVSSFFDIFNLSIDINKLILPDIINANLALSDLEIMRKLNQYLQNHQQAKWVSDGLLEQLKQGVPKLKIADSDDAALILKRHYEEIVGINNLIKEGGLLDFDAKRSDYYECSHEEKTDSLVKVLSLLIMNLSKNQTHDDFKELQSNAILNNIKVVITGGSNSVMEKGWIKHLYMAKNIDIVNLSLGASCSLLGVARLLTNKEAFKNADYMLIEFCINDQAYALHEGILEENTIEIYLNNMIEIALSAKVKPIVIIFPTSECYTSQSDRRTLVRNLYKKSCQRYGVMYIDFSDYIEGEVFNKKIKGVYFDQWHYHEIYANEFGKRILNILNRLSSDTVLKGLTLLPNSITSPSLFSDYYVETDYLVEYLNENVDENTRLKNKINYFNIKDYLESENLNYYKIENSVFNGFFYQLTKDTKLMLHVNGSAVIYGILANYKGGGAVIKVECQKQQTVIKNMYNFWGVQNELHVAVTHFVQPVCFDNSITLSILDDIFSDAITEKTLFEVSPNGCEKLGIAGLLIEGSISSISIEKS